MDLHWQFIETAPPEAVLHLAHEANVPPIIARVMLNRGIDSKNAALTFFRTELERLHDPFLMAGMKAAVTRLSTALARKENMLIYGDYDVDGITGTALLKLAFRHLGFDIPHYIPDRLRDGYGISRRGIDLAKSQGVTLILAVDCGVSAREEIAYARELGIDFIVCDHHQPGPQLPPARALLNPKRSDCPYPFKELAGVGVAFKLMQALFLHCEQNLEELYRHLDLVAVGSTADIVPLVDENRVFVKAGLERINQTENVGLRALLQVCGLALGTINTGNVVFILAPRINAVGRMGDATRAVTLLTTNDATQAMEIARVLEMENRERRSVDDETYREALQMIETQCDPTRDLIFVLQKEGWHTGVIGIVASRVVEKFYRPTIMISTQNGVGKGSARSIPGFDLYKALQECEQHLLAFGGHKYAAGLSINTEHIAALRERMQTVAARILNKELLTPRLLLDGEIRLGEIDQRFMKFLEALAPYGPQNMRPAFVSRGLRVVGTPQIVGNNHLRFHVTQDDRRLDCIGFNLGDLRPRLVNGGENVDLAYLVEENTWQGRTTIQLRVKDIR
ncbi:single-stranded-DNA-specific exonuclease RecJ [candidate division KSB1 bacterium]|nr:single-stranded-DNA-specific exonuclease RecJ [candidate division KSB1 bacterium]